MGWPATSGAGRGDVAGQVVLTPACGLAGASPAYARAALAHCREAARLLPELIEEG
jgi:ammonia channel protein AmtB